MSLLMRCTKCGGATEAFLWAGDWLSVCCMKPVERPTTEQRMDFTAKMIAEQKKRREADDQRFARTCGVFGFILLVVVILLLLCGCSCGGRRLNEKIPHGNNGTHGADGTYVVEASHVQRVDGETSQSDSASLGQILARTICIVLEQRRPPLPGLGDGGTGELSNVASGLPRDRIEGSETEGDGVGAAKNTTQDIDKPWQKRTSASQQDGVRDAVVQVQLGSRRMFRLIQVPNPLLFGQLGDLEAEVAQTEQLVADLKAKIQKAKGS